MEASLLVQHTAAPPALHLRHLNQHLHGALAGHTGGWQCWCRQLCSLASGLLLDLRSAAYACTAVLTAGFNNCTCPDPGAVSIARGGPYGLPNARAASPLLVGVSSFGAQGTNAHALLAGSGAAAVISVGSSSQLAPAWRRSRCYVAPAVQQLLTSCLLHKRSRGGSMAFDSILSAPRLAYLWQYSMQGRAHLASSALLSMAASLLPLLGAVTDGEDQGAAAVVAAVTEATLVAPTLLPQAAAAKVAPAVARVKLSRASGAVEVALSDQQLMAAKLGAAVPVATPAVPAEGLALAVHTRSSALRSLAVATVAFAAPGAVAQTAVLSAAEVSGYALHPLLLDACLGQAAAVAAAAAAAVPLTWLRSVAALLVGASSPAGSSIAAAYQPAGSWHAGSAALAAADSATPAAALLGVVLGEHDMPPASPGPSGAQLSARVGEGAEEEEEAAGTGVPADHPLLQMGEEERLMHLQAQVRLPDCLAAALPWHCACRALQGGSSPAIRPIQLAPTIPQMFCGLAVCPWDAGHE
jgi:hypothetical protein